MITMKSNSVIETAIEVNGAQMQQIVAMEELAELQKEVSKMIRNKGNRAHLVEEIADVHIVLATLIKIHNIHEDEVQKEVTKKIERLNNRLSEGTA